MSRKLPTWDGYVKRYFKKLGVDYPCATTSSRQTCPRHGNTIGPVIRVCKACFDGIYDELGANYSTLLEELTAQELETDA